MQPLIRPWQLIRDTWTVFVKTWETTVRVSIWFIVVGIISALGSMVPDSIPGYLLIFVLDVIGVLVAIWTTIRLYQTVFALEGGEAVTERTTATAVALIWPVLIVEALAGLSVFGGVILLILPGIWIAVRLAFSQVSVIDPKSAKRGVDALKESWGLTKGKFWPLLGRLVLGGILFAVAVGVIMAVCTALVGAIAGPGQFTAALNSDQPPVALGAALTFIQGIVQAALMPLVPIFQVKLYQSVRSAQ
jgi:hypothetical protein